MNNPLLMLSRLLSVAWRALIRAISSHAKKRAAVQATARRVSNYAWQIGHIPPDIRRSADFCGDSPQLPESNKAVLPLQLPIRTVATFERPAQRRKRVGEF